MLDTLDELIRMQRKKIKVCAEQLIPHITEDDLLQPNDFPLLENNPYFRHEEGVLEGLLTARMAFLSQQRVLQFPLKKHQLLPEGFSENKGE